jgi:hypothetical protein
LFFFVVSQIVFTQATLVCAPKLFALRLEQAPPASVYFGTVLDFVAKSKFCLCVNFCR